MTTATVESAAPPGKRLLNVQQVARKLGVCVRTVWKKRAEGSLPAPVSLNTNGHLIRWREEDIDAWIDQLPLKP
jgi:excisionase family DNA binding protein